MASAALGKAVMEADAAVAQVSREKARWKINFHWCRISMVIIDLVFFCDLQRFLWCLPRISLGKSNIFFEVNHH